MHATTVAVDLAKNVFELAVADEHWRVVQRQRLSRTQFERWFANRAVSRVVMEACGSAQHWARWLMGQGIEMQLLPPRYVRPYVKRNKTDTADAAALLEALRCADIVPVRPKSVEQQALQSLHRIRSAWMATRTARINGLRGFCREFGLVIAEGSRLGLEQIARAWADPATAMVAATGGSASHFKDARHFASWFGLTPKEHSSGGTRHLGRISKRGDRYLRARQQARAHLLRHAQGRDAIRENADRSQAQTPGLPDAPLNASFPPQMPDIRLQAFPQQPSTTIRSQVCGRNPTAACQSTHAPALRPDITAYTIITHEPRPREAPQEPAQARRRPARLHGSIFWPDAHP
jgi:transposase